MHLCEAGGPHPCIVVEARPGNDIHASGRESGKKKMTTEEGNSRNRRSFLPSRAVLAVLHFRHPFWQILSCVCPRKDNSLTSTPSPSPFSPLPPISTDRKMASSRRMAVVPSFTQAFHDRENWSLSYPLTQHLLVSHGPHSRYL